jgi:hypothetical protein
MVRDTEFEWHEYAASPSRQPWTVVCIQGECLEFKVAWCRLRDLCERRLRQRADVGALVGVLKARVAQRPVRDPIREAVHDRGWIRPWRVAEAQLHEVRMAEARRLTEQRARARGESLDQVFGLAP